MDTPTPLSGRTIAFIGFVLILIILGAAYHFHFRSMSLRSSFLPKGTFLVLGANALPAHEARRIDLKNGELVLLSVPGQGTAHVVDVASTSNHVYYLMSGPAAGETTLYQLDPAHPGAGLAQLTTSKSPKVDLSVDTHENFAVFATKGSGSSTEIISLNLQSGKEKNLGAGAHPIIFPDGSGVIVERDNALVLINNRTGDAHELVKGVPTGSIVAFSNSSGQLAFYDASANVLHRYQISEQISGDRISANERGSDVPGERPQALFYVGKDLYMARMLPGTLVLSNIDATRDVRITVPGFSLDGFNLIAL